MSDLPFDPEKLSRNFAHTAQRLSERYGVVLTPRGYEALVEQAAKAEIRAKEYAQASPQTVRVVMLGDRPILVVRDETDGLITTVLPWRR